jgi:hypothetical protein
MPDNRLTAFMHKQISISAILIERIKDGKVVEYRGLFDGMSMMQHLSAVPPP